MFRKLITSAYVSKINFTVTAKLLSFILSVKMQRKLLKRALRI